MIGRDEKPTDQTDGVLEVSPDTSNEVGLGGSVYSPDLRDTIESVNRGVGLKITSKWDQDHALNVFQRSDQFPFALKGVPAFWWFTGFHPDYHKPTDTVEKINFTKMAKILRLAYQSGLAVANQEGHPRFVPDPKPR
jgi:Zn-dependent M28 family amino/carboxypeptidase